MHCTFRRTCGLLAITLGALCANATGQIVINEVLYDPAGADAGAEIIEIVNLGSSPQNLTGMSLCVNAGPVSRVYWGFPNGTSIPAGGIIQVHWMTNGANTATDLFTGTAASNFGCLAPFLMSNTHGSVAIYSIPASNCLGFGFAANIVDFVQYGAGGTIREPVAAGAGSWRPGPPATSWSGSTPT